MAVTHSRVLAAEEVLVNGSCFKEASLCFFNDVRLCVEKAEPEVCVASYDAVLTVHSFDVGNVCSIAILRFFKVAEFVL